MSDRLIDPGRTVRGYLENRLGARTQRRTDAEVRHLQAYARRDPATNPPVVTGSRSTGEALENLLSVLHVAGVVTDQTTD